MTPTEIEYTIERLDRQMDEFCANLTTKQWDRLHKSRKALLEALVVGYEAMVANQS